MSDRSDGSLAALARLITARPWTVALSALVVSTAAGLLAWHGLGIQTDRIALIGKQHRYNRVYTKMRAEFGDLDAMVVVIEGPDRAAERAAGDALAAEVRKDPATFPALFHRVDPDALDGKALLFQDVAGLKAIESRLKTGRRPAEALFARGLGPFFQTSAELVRELIQGKAPTDINPEDLAFLPPFAAGVEQALQGRPPPDAPWQAWIPPGALQGRDGYVWTRDGRLVLLVQPARRPSGEAEPRSIEALRELTRALTEARPGVTAGLTGEPVLELDELKTFRHDALLSTIVSLLGVTLLFLIAFRRLLGPLLATATTACAVVTTLGVATLWPGHLNLISVALCALMIGLGIDYAIHLISRWDEERARGRDGAEALSVALSGTGRAIAAGSITTALAFLATLFSEVQGIREFGVIAGAGVLLSLVANLLVLPALVVLADRTWGGRLKRPYSTWPRSRMVIGVDRLVERRPKLLVAGGLLLAGAAVAAAVWPVETPSGLRPRLHYEANLLQLQAQGLESVRLAGQILTDPGLSGMFAGVVVHDLPSLREVRAQVEALPTVSDTASILDLIPVDQPQKQAILRRIGALVAALPQTGPTPAPDPARLDGLAAGAEALERVLEDAARDALQASRPADAERVVALQEQLSRIAALARDPAQRAVRARRLAEHERSLLALLRDALRRLTVECHAGTLTADDLPPALRERFVGKTGKLLLRVYPTGNVWDPRQLAAFVTDLQQIAPEAGGVPVMLYESDELMRAGFLRAGVFALVFVVFYLVIHFRGVLLPLVATATLLVGACWGLGLLLLLGQRLNPANLLALPLTFGIGIDYAIHLVTRDREARTFRSVAGAPAVVATSSGRAVWLSALTTMVGFGALTLSAHRGVSSIGWTICLGVLGCFLAALVFGPALLRIHAGPSKPLALTGLPGPKTGPGGRTIRPDVNDDPPSEPGAEDDPPR